jgi:hypothetical protein
MHEDVIISNFEVEVGEQCEQTHVLPRPAGSTSPVTFFQIFHRNVAGRHDSRLDFPLNQLELNCDVRGALDT